uniref:Uncharacterized protein n=1 Tax=Arundo donax TaxID=35708 RepID=A0A0A9C172_ARUDO
MILNCRFYVYIKRLKCSYVFYNNVTLSGNFSSCRSILNMQCKR